MMSVGRPEITGFDEHGFAIFVEGSLHQSRKRSHELEYQAIEQLSSDVLPLQLVWDKLERNLDPKHVVSPQKIRSFIKKGIPRELRGDLWQLLGGSKSLKNNATFDYQEKLSEVRHIMVDYGVTEYDNKKNATRISKLTGSYDDKENGQTNSVYIDEETLKKLSSFRQILLDADRSFPSHQMFMEGTEQGKEGRATLFRILAVYVLYNPEVAYCQGMSYIAGMLLMNMGEEDAFWMLVSLFERPKYLSGYFDSSLSKIKKHSQVFARFLRQKMPKLYCHLKCHAIDPVLYLTPWFMALFTSLPCWDTVLTIWDLLLLDGISVIFQVSLAILHVLSDQLLAASDMSSILPILLHLPSERIKRSHLVPVIWHWTIYSWEVEAVLAIINDGTGNNIREKPEHKRKLCENTNSRPTKRRRITSEKSVAVERRKPVGLLARVSGLVKNIFSNSTSSVGATCSVNAICREDKYSANRGKRRQTTFQNLRITSPLRRSPRLARFPTVTSKDVNTPNEVVNSSPNTKHAFKMFNTPTPMRNSKISKKIPLDHLTEMPHLSLSPDVELHIM